MKSRINSWVTASSYYNTSVHILSYVSKCNFEGKYYFAVMKVSAIIKISLSNMTLNLTSSKYNFISTKISFYTYFYVYENYPSISGVCVCVCVCACVCVSVHMCVYKCVGHLMSSKKQKSCCSLISQNEIDSISQPLLFAQTSLPYGLS